eukprot:4669026-Pleurochrysis_carterae.AAC.1
MCVSGFGLYAFRSLWERLESASKFGDCLVTVATGEARLCVSVRRAGTQLLRRSTAVGHTLLGRGSDCAWVLGWLRGRENKDISDGVSE